MGLCSSEPLRKTTNSLNTPSLTRNQSALPQHFVVQTNNKTEKQSNENTNDDEGETHSAIPDPPRPYFSFTSFMLQNENPQIYEWLFIKELGKGSMSQVFLVKNTETEIICAAKVYNNSVLHRQTVGNEDPPIHCLQKEIEIMTEINHPNILSLHEFINDAPTNSVIVIIPYATNGTLDSIIQLKNLTLNNLLICCYQIAEGLRFLHSLNIAHRDIKPSSIMSFTEKYYCLSDFSLSIKMKSNDEYHIDTKGSIINLSPEETSGNEFYLKPADVWKFGITFYWIFFQQYPFGLGQSLKKNQIPSPLFVSQCLKEENLEFPSDINISSEIKFFFSKLLNKDPNSRPTFEEIINFNLFKEAHELQKNEIIPNFESNIITEYSNEELK